MINAKKLYIVITSVILALGSGLAVIVFSNKDPQNFAECKKMEGVIQQSDPEKCVMNGKTFVNQDQRVKLVAPTDRTAPKSYKECVDGGGAILESYPEQCALEGKIFTNPNQKVNGAN